MSKTLQTRVQMKHDTETNWNKATNFVPLAGEIIVYDVDALNPTQRMKIGNGIDILSNLPFTYLPLSGGVMTGFIDMGANKITNLLNPSAETDATTKNYVDERIYIGSEVPTDTNKLWIDPDDNSSSGGTGSGSGSSSITTDALPLAGGTMQGTINMNGNKITNLVTPTADSDAATKSYVDNLVSSSGGTGSGGSSSGGLTQVFHAGTSAPSNTNLLWIDTNSTSGGLKYYNGTSWVHVPVAYT